MAPETTPHTPGPAPPDGGDGRRIGRAAFLGALGAGLAGIVVAPRIGGDVNGVLSSILPIPRDGWRIYNVAAPLPTFDPATYRLRVSGLVERPLDLAWSDVAAMPGAHQTSDFHCVTGWSVRGCAGRASARGPCWRWPGPAPRRAT